jgi:hypothetical protein
MTRAMTRAMTRVMARAMTRVMTMTIIMDEDNADDNDEDNDDANDEDNEHDDHLPVRVLQLLHDEVEVVPAVVRPHAAVEAQGHGAHGGRPIEVVPGAGP